MSNVGSGENCQVNCKCSKKLIVLKKRLKNYEADLKYQRLWTKFVGEWILHKFGFDVNLRIKMEEKDKAPDPEEEESEDDEEQELENECSHNRPARSLDQSSSLNGNQGTKRQLTIVDADRNSMGSKAPKMPKHSTTSDFTALSLSTVVVPIKPEFDGSGSEDIIDNDENVEESSVGLEISSVTTSNNSTGISTINRVQIIHEEDPDIDIKYDPFGHLDLQNDDGNYDTNTNTHGASKEDESLQEESQESDPFADVPSNNTVVEKNRQSQNRTIQPINSAASTIISAFEEQIRTLGSSWQSSTFDLKWIMDMKKYQKGLMPYTMFIKRDDIRQWFEYLPNKDNPNLSRFRCRLCYKYVPAFGYPQKYWGPVESEVGQLKKSETDNRNAINLHALKQSHKEIILRLNNEIKKKNLRPAQSDLGMVVEFTKQKKKQLLECLDEL